MTTTVLFPGASLGSWIWDDLAREMDALVLPLPFRDNEVARRTATWDSIVDTVAEQLHVLGGPVRLVGHSIGGLVASGVAAKRRGLVAEIVYIASVLPAQGKSFLSVVPPPARWIVRMLYRRNPAGMVPSAKMLRNEYGGGLPMEIAERIWMEPVSDAPAMFTKPIDWRHPEIASKYIMLTRDRSVPVKAQRASARRVPTAKVFEIATGHLPMLSAPDQLRDALLR